MKKYQSVIFILLFALGFITCKKSDTNFTPITELAVGSYIRSVSFGTTRFNSASPTLGADKVSIVVKGVGEPIDKIISYVSTSNNSLDKTTWKKIIETTVTDNDNITIAFTGSQFASALGVATSGLAPGTSFVIYNEILTKSGKIYNINNINGDAEAAAAYAMVFRYNVSVVCPFTGNMTGTYKVIADPNWQDWSPGDLVQVTDGPAANQINISKVYPNPALGSVGSKPLVVDVDPASGAATIPTGSATAFWGNYGSYVAYTGAGSSGFVFSCTGRINLKIHIVVTVFGDQGFNTLILQKQ